MGIENFRIPGSHFWDGEFNDLVVPSLKSICKVAGGQYSQINNHFFECKGNDVNNEHIKTEIGKIKSQIRESLRKL